MPEVSPNEWADFVSSVPDAHLLQTEAWGELKVQFGWRPLRVILPAGGARLGAQVLLRRLPLGFCLAYLPRGPVCAGPPGRSVGEPGGNPGPVRGAPADTPGSGGADFAVFAPLWAELDALLRRERAVFLKVEPDLWEPADAIQRPAPAPGFTLSLQDIQPPRTILIDLSGSEDEVLGRMKQKTRYNIRLALKKGVVVYPSSDIEAFHRLMAATGVRDGFAVHSLEYYRSAYDLFYPKGECELLIAAYEDEPLAALMVFARGSRAWYFYGASADAHRERMPSYLLQWEAMRWARSRGCTLYDLWGVPDADEAALEAHFTGRSAGLWGVYRFKRGFGGRLARSLGPWDRVYNPVLYWLYKIWISRREIV